MGIIVEDCSVVEHVTSDGGTVYKIRMKIDGKFYLSDKEYTIDKAIKFRDEWRKSAGRG